MLSSLVLFCGCPNGVEPPAAPTGLNATPGDSSATASWIAPSDNGGAAITSYTVTATPGGSTATTADGATTTLQLAGLTNGTSYTLTVHATNSAGNSAESAPSAPFMPLAPTPLPTAPSAPTAVRAIGGDGQATVSWTAPADGGSPITGYTVLASPGSATASTSGATTAIVSGLADGTAYTFTVIATNAVGSSPASAPSAPVTPESAAEATAMISSDGGTVSLANGSAVVVPANALDAGTEISIAATANTPAPQNAVPVGDAVVLSPEGQQFAAPVTVTLAFDPSLLPIGMDASSVVILTAPAGSSNYTSLGGALADATHVQAESSHFSVFQPAILLAPAQVAPDAPGSVRAVATDGAATVSWTAPASTGAGPLTGYAVTASPGGAIVSTAGATSASFGGLQDGTTYTFTVVASNASAASAPSLASEPVTPLASPRLLAAAPNAGFVATNGQSVAWVSTVGTSSSVWAMPADGGTPVDLAAGGGAIALDNSYVYFAESGNIERVAIDGGSPLVIASGSYGGASFAVDATNVYWGDVNTGKVYKAPKAGGTPVALDNGQPAYVAVDSTYVYWTNSSGTVQRVPIAGGTSVPLAAGQASPTQLALAAGDVFWTNEAIPPGTGTLRDVSTDGGAVALFAGGQSPFGIAADSASIYWTNYLVSGTLCSEPLDGGAPVVLAASLPEPYGVAVSPTQIFWTENTSTGGVMSMPKPVIASGTPGAPTAVVASGGISGSTVSWTAPVSGASGYSVVSVPDGVTAQTSGATTVFVGDLTPGTSYTFVVFASSAAGTGPASAPSNAVVPTLQTSAPAAPGNVRATASYQSALVSWSAPDDHGSALTGYTISYGQGGAATAAAGATSTVISGLTTGTSYTFSVSAENAAGTGPAAESNSITPSAQLESWVDVTPASEAMIAFASSSGRLFAVSPGAAWFASDGGAGQQWAAFSTGLPLGISGISSLTSLNGTLYLSVSSGVGIGIYKTSDQGANWQPYDTALPGQGVNLVQAVGAQLYLSLSNGEAGSKNIFVSNGTGAWTQQDTGLPSSDFVAAFAAYNNKVFAGTLAGNGVWAWNGSTWSGEGFQTDGASMSSDDGNGLAVVGSRLFVGTEEQGLWSGATGLGDWTRASTSPQWTSADITRLTAVGSRLYFGTNGPNAGSAGGIFWTEDSGVTINGMNNGLRVDLFGTGVQALYADAHTVLILFNGRNYRAPPPGPELGQSSCGSYTFGPPDCQACMDMYCCSVYLACSNDQTCPACLSDDCTNDPAAAAVVSCNESYAANCAPLCSSARR